MSAGRRNVCFVTGTRAEYGLMRSTLAALRDHPAIRLQLIATGMHLDRRAGRSIDSIRAESKIDRIIPWRSAKTQTETAAETGRVMAKIAGAFEELKTDVALVVGDRVEAFAAASAAHIGGKLVAHVHGGDRALGIVDDSLRHAITKLAHLHFPATAQSAQRLKRLGEDAWRVHTVGSPGLDDLRDAEDWSAVAARFPQLKRRQYALLVLHPESADAAREQRSAQMILKYVGLGQTVVIYPNNDPGADGIRTAWDAFLSSSPGTPGEDRGGGSQQMRFDLRTAPSPALPRSTGGGRKTNRANARSHQSAVGANKTFCRNLPRRLYLGLLRDAAMLIGNSSSGIIEAASFGTPVINIGHRQDGRERSGNVIDVPVAAAAIRRAIGEIWNRGKPLRFKGKNVYVSSGAAGKAIADVLARFDPDRHVRKLISY
jgi:UDP-hydrolysing UDP-N-acetyl-D-glucosamine 2-epimerase